MLLQGCASIREPSGERSGHSWEQRQVELRALQEWTLSGKASFRTPERSATVTLNWSRQADSWQVRGNGSFGQGAFRAEQDDNGGLLWRSGEKLRTGSSVIELLRQESGVAFPVAELDYWIKGLPAPGPVTDQMLNDQAELTRLVQGDWEIQYLDYGLWGGLRLPKKMFVSGPETELRFVIHTWVIHTVPRRDS